ncbi:hypothetical protein P3X46_024534 [Hevea brasiliensis]|uniref:YTH domain-containing family protein n=1 Tax=Hevea brasiliensis TaxID=3981 RepID=A0ABQ9L4J3_HEVBR|nr:hypothetical protein P3X46_024534 [Hevea brasiliensis]
MKSNGNIGGKSSKSTNTQAIRPLNKVSTFGSDFSAGLLKGYHPASTLNGNKKLDAAFREAEQRSGGTGTKCPIFLFFSVNGSGQFVGIAEMVGEVDFDKDMDFWQLDKWNGFFPVRWHVIKDITNSHLRHIILENNDGQPVTYSRGSQEIGVLDLSKRNLYTLKRAISLLLCEWKYMKMVIFCFGLVAELYEFCCAMLGILPRYNNNNSALSLA